MRKLLLSGIALGVLVAPVAAADLQAMPQRYTPVTIWTGVYIGGHAGEIGRAHV